MIEVCINLVTFTFIIINNFYKISNLLYSAFIYSLNNVLVNSPIRSEMCTPVVSQENNVVNLIEYMSSRLKGKTKDSDDRIKGYYTFITRHKENRLKKY